MSTQDQTGEEAMEFIDNQDNVMMEVLPRVLQQGANEVRISTAYLNPAGLKILAKSLSSTKSVKLLLGTEPGAEFLRWERKLGESEGDYKRRYWRRSFERNEELLRASLNHEAFTMENFESLMAMKGLLSSDHFEVRLYDKQFLHAKTYIISSCNDEAKQIAAVYVGSSNLTAAGMRSNIELNLGCRDDDLHSRSIVWFDKLWDEAKEYDLAALYAEPLEDRRPHDIFLRILWEYYHDELDDESKQGLGVSLTSFQKHGVSRAEKVIEEYHGAIVADEVGLGKTYIAGEIIERYTRRRQNSLVLCPASLCSTWDKYARDANKYIEAISYDKLANFISGKHGRGSVGRSTGPKLALDNYQLIVVDEAHNFRNPKTSNRAQTLIALLKGSRLGERKDVLLLTATPVNNSIMDLYYLLHYFIKRDTQFRLLDIQSLRAHFKEADKSESLSPDMLFPIVDATTIKRTRSFIIEHYKNDTITDQANKTYPIVFPKPVPKTVRYELDEAGTGLFDSLQKYLVPEDNGRENPDMLKFARYRVEEYRGGKDDLYGDNEDMADSMRYTGFLRVLILKRFESSIQAFLVTLERMIDQHKKFLKRMRDGQVLTSQYFRRYYQLVEDGRSDENKQVKEAIESRSNFELHEDLQRDVENDLDKLEKLHKQAAPSAKNDEKLKQLVKELVIIADEAKRDGKSSTARANKRKVLIFSAYADTVLWIYEYLKKAVDNDLSDYKSRLNYVVGSNRNAADDPKHEDKGYAAKNFAPQTAGGGGANDIGKYDILVTTDVLAEGQNLQQARHIINFDMPWNPMRLVQRHGRIDRLNSKHKEVYLRTFFPIDMLDALLNLEHKIQQKISKASASVGVQSPIEHMQARNADFAQNKEEIEKLEREDASLYVNRGTLKTNQSGEEYRQLLCKSMKYVQENIKNMLWKAGSGMCRGKEQGIVFCAKVDKHPYLRFVRTDSDWNLRDAPGEDSLPAIEDSLGACLRIASCKKNEKTVLAEQARAAAFELWPVAQRHIHAHWMKWADPKNLRVPIRKLNVDVADFIRRIRPKDIPTEDVDTAIDILSAPLEHNVEVELRGAFKAEGETRAEKSKKLVTLLLDSGLEPPDKPDPNPSIEPDRVELLVWLAITAE